MQKKLLVIGAVAFLMLGAYIVVGTFGQSADDEIARRPYRYWRGAGPIVRDYYRGPSYYASPRYYRNSYYRNYRHRPYYYERGVHVGPGHVSVGPVDVEY